MVYALAEPAMESFFSTVMIISYLSFLCCLFALQHMANLIYASLHKRQTNPYNFLNILDLLIFAVYLTNISVTYGKNLDGTWEEKPVIGE